MPAFAPEDYLGADPLCAAGASHFMDPFAEDFTVKHNLTLNSKVSISAVVSASFQYDMSDASNGASKWQCRVDQKELPKTLEAVELNELPRSPAVVGEMKGVKDENKVYGIGTSSIGDLDIPCPRSTAPKGVCTISAEDARQIFVAKMDRTRCKKDGLATRLGEHHGISAKAVRDIWRLRTWQHATWPCWTPEDRIVYLKKGLCSSCRTAGLTSIKFACDLCKDKASIAAIPGND